MSDKVQKALEERKKRKEEASKNSSTDKVSAALEARKNRMKGNATSAASDILNRYNSAIDSYKSYITDNSSLASGTYSEGVDLKSVLDDQRERSLAVSKLIRDIEAYRGYIGEDAADKALADLKGISGGYSGILKNAEYLSQYKTEDEYQQAVKEQDKIKNWADPEYLKTLSLSKDTYSSIYDNYENYFVPKAGTMDKEKTQKSGVITYYNKADEEAATKERDAWLANVTKQALGVPMTAEELAEKYNLTRLEYAQAQRYSNGLKLTNDALNAEDFAEKSQYVSTKADGILDKLTSDALGYNDSTYEYINNVDGYRDNYKDANRVYSRNNPYGDDESSLESKGYAHLTPDEVAVYNYYYATEGKEKAEEYLDTIQETLNMRKAGVDFKEIEGRTFKELGFGVEAGLDQFKSGMASLVNTKDDYIPPSSTQMMSGMVREDLADNGPQILGSSLGQIGYDLTTTTSNMIPSIVTSAAISYINPVAGQVVGAGLMGASAAGNAYAETINLGYDKGEARLYSGMVGASEATLQYLLGGIGKLGGGKLTTEAVVGIANNMDNAFARVALKLGANAAGEFTEEYLQEVLNPFFKNLTLGTSEDIKLFSTEALYSGILGALSAGVLEGGSTISSDIQTTKLGKKVQNIDGGVERLKKLGTTFSADAVAHQIADKVTEETGAYKIGLLLQEVGGSLSEQNISDIVAELTKKGMAESDAKKLAKTYQAFIDNEMTLTDEQIKVLEGCDPLSDVLRKSIIGRNTSVYQRSREYNELFNLATDMVMDAEASPAPQTDAEETSQNFAPYSQEYLSSAAKEFEAMGMSAEHAKIMAQAKLSSPSKSNSTPTVEKAVESKFEVSEDNETINTKTGEAVKVVGIESIKGGEMVLRVENSEGKTESVKATDVSFSADDALIYSAVADMGASETAAWNIVKNFKPTDGVSANVYAQDVAFAYKYGVLNYKQGLSNLDLTADQALVAFYQGRNDSDAKLKPEKSRSRTTTARVKGKVIFEGFKYNEKKANPNQKASMAAINFIAEISPLEVHVYESKRENGQFVAYINGKKRIAPNGYFIEGTNKIYIDINAGSNGEGLMLDTAGHEISHYIAEWNWEGFKELGDFLFEHYGADVPVNTLIENQKARVIESYKRDGKAIPSEDVLFQKAYEETVADAMSKMLADERAYVKLAELKQQNRTLWEKLGEAIKNLLNKIKSLIGAYSNKDFVSQDAKYVAEFSKDVYEKLQDLYLKAFMGANEAVTSSDIASIDTDSKSVSPVMSERTWTASEYVTEREKTAKAISSALGVDIKTAYKYIDDINSVARLIADDRVRLDYDPNIDENATVLKKNSDYKYSVDMSTLCAKRLLTTGTFDAIQRRLPNTVFTSEDIVALREMMLKRGYEVACGICYVESTRREMGRITQDFIDSYIKSQKTGKPITRTNSSGQAVDLKKTKDEMLTTADKSANKFYADKDYTPTLADLNTTDIDLVKRDHPLVYEAYLNFMNARGQAKPKLLETRAEYKGEILKHFKAKSAVNSRNKAGGLRLQSFSDFEVPHLIDMMQIIMDMSRVGLMSQAYTKVPDFAEVFGNTGVKINLSLIAKGSGLDANGNLIFDDVEGINHEEAFRLRDKFSKNVGTILVGKTDAHIIAAMADPRIDYIIPFHKSSWKESLYEALGLTGYADYTDTQNEKPIDKNRTIKNFEPSEYWDFTKSGDENAQIYLEMCRKDGRIPKFPQFQGYPGYWKLLIDFKMYDNDGVGSPQEVVRPTFEMDAANKILDEYKGGHKSFPVAKDVVEDFVSNYANNIKFSERGSNKAFSEDFTAKTLNSFGITKLNDSIHIQRQVLTTLLDEKFFTDTEKRSRTDVNKESGLVIETNKSGIDETFSFNNFVRLGKFKKIAKLATIRELPNVIKNGHVVADNVANKYDNVANNKKFAYIEHSIEVEGKEIVVKLAIKKSPQKNKFWVHSVYTIENVSDSPASTNEGTEAGHITADTGDIVPQEAETVKIFSDRDLVPTFYSQMGKVVEGVKQEKLAANSVVNMLRGKGVKAEEIRWSGIVPFLEGKKSVTKQELLDFINGSMLQIGEQMSSNDIDLRYDTPSNSYTLYDANGKAVDTYTYNEFMGGYVSDATEEIYSNSVELEDALREEYGSMSSPRWSEYKLDGGTNYRELVFTMPNSTYTNRAMKVHWGQDAEGVLVHARIQDFDVNGKKMLFIEEIQSDWHNEGHKGGYESNISNDERVEFDELEKTIDALNKQMDAIDKDRGVLNYDYFKLEKMPFDEYEKKWHSLDSKHKEITDKLNRSINKREKLFSKFKGTTPDAPFKDNYHEYVLKRLLRTAAEQGYDSIGWTPADIQDKRWSDHQAHEEGKGASGNLVGYTIEYDQDMPKFLRKYGRQWGAKVGTATVSNTEVWSMNITDSMKESVLYEGQVMYSDRDSEGNTLTKEQVEYFKDSKVRDKNGNLLVVYHGTPNGDFNTFKISDGAHNSLMAQYGAGYYFDSNKASAKRYTQDVNKTVANRNPKVFETYLNVKNPLVIHDEYLNGRKPVITKQQFNDVVTKGNYEWFFSNGMPFELTKYLEKSKAEIQQLPREEIIKHWVDMVYERAYFDSEILSAMVKAYKGDSILGVMKDVFGNDGVHVIDKYGEMWVAWDNSQIKETTNKTPTTDPDIRYSERVSNKELAEMDDTALYIKNTKKANYIGMIFNGTKTEETRSQKTLDAFIGKDFYVTDGKYVYGTVVFGEPHKYTEAEFHKKENQRKHRVPKGDEYDVKPGGIKWAYPIESYNKFDKPKKLSDSKEYKNSFQARQVMFSERDNSTSNRSILANALEGAAQNDIEKNKLKEYKEKISLIESEEQRLAEIQKKLFTKGEVDPAQRKELQFEAKQISNRINTYDRQLLNLEATTALKNVLNREKALAMKRQKQKDTEYLKQYKEKVAKTQRELLERNQESRKKAIEGREKTAMRHKIKSVVNDLNNLLLKPTKERHVPEEMRIAVAEALSVVNMDTVSADERVAKYNALIAKATDPDIIASLTATRDRILEQGDKMSDKLAKLKDAYGMVRDSADDSVRSMYDDVIYSKIESVQRTVGKTPLRNMTLSQLESVYDLYKMVLTTIRGSNKAFAENIKMTRMALGSNTFAEIKDNNKARDTIKHEFLEKFMWQNLKPMQAMKTIGSETLQKLWNNILYGQEVFAVDYDEAVKFAEEMKEKHGYEKWDKDKLYSFASKSGKTMKLNLEQMMSIYAYSKRAQADEHIEYGGIVLNEGVIKVKNKLGKTVEVKVNDSTAYRLDKLQVAGIISALEKEFPGAKAFVDDMQKYLSETMGEKGNEVSMKMYGIKLFKEEHYFPLKSSKDFMEAANAKLKGDVKIKNKGMTKSTVEHARNPIVLEGFLDVWGNHINEMALYHGLVLPLEDFSRTLNYSFKADDNLNTDAESVRTALHDAFGESADNYLNELLKAINGGVLHDSSAQFADKMISKFKKAKVMASLSVVVQQPTAIIRAMGIIDPKYFVAQNFNHKATWEELKKYCPTAIIKETGSFDTNMGRTIVDMIKDERGFTDKVGDVLGKAPAYMDEVGWNMIWRALKKKIATEQKLSGEALLEECGKQMTLIINETQVYDSVMSRNELMRSKNALTKMATAFMAEPSTVANMVYGAALDFKRGKKGMATKTVAAVITSVVINGLVSSLVYALRDDDDEKTLLEKFLSSATTEVVDGLNPLTYIPFVKDAYSLFQGYKVERTDMALIKDVVDAVDSFYKVLDPEEYEDMSKDEIAKHIYENSIPMLTSICDMFGLPVGNVLRDAEAIIINDNIPMSQTSSSGIGYAFKEGLLGALPKIVGKVIGTDSKQDKLYDAIVSGDTAYIERLKSGYKDDKAYESAVRKALRENDPRIKVAAEARINGDIAEYTRIVKEIKAEGFFSQDTIVASVNAEINAINKGESTESSDSNKAKSMYKIDDYYASIVGGDQASAYVVKEDIINTAITNGKSRDDAKDSFNGQFASYLREEFEKGNISTREAEKMLVNYGDKSEEDAASKVQYWEFKQDYPDYDDLSEEAVSKYYNDVEPYGITVDVYYDYSKRKSNCTGKDANNDGKTDSGSKKAEILQVINALPISRSQKDVLYYLNGWSAKTLYEAPWH